MNLRWLVSVVTLGALCVAPSILLRAQTPDQTSQPNTVQGQEERMTGPGCALGRFNVFTVERQVAVGRSLAQQIELHAKFVGDPVVNEYANRILQNMVRNSDAHIPFTIKVIDSDVVNAVALPGGSFYINSGLLLAVDEESEVAGIMAHEIAHVAACHAGRLWTTAEKASMPPPIVASSGGIDDMVGMFGILTFTRGFEAEADYLGIDYMYRAGYDPSGLISFFERIHAMENTPWRPGAVARSFRTHPQNADRVEKAQKEIRSILPAREQYIVTNSEFDEVKARLAAIENERKVIDQKGSNKPNLRRASKHLMVSPR
jgi:predicted Zn-dependent protease